MEADWVGYYDTLLRYHLHIDPDTLDDTRWATTIAQLADIRKQEANAKR